MTTNRQIDSGKLPLDGQPHAIVISVPSAGTYYFDFDDSGAGWRIAAAPGRHMTWLPPRGRKMHVIGQLPELYFYVPKGLRQVQLFYSGRPCKLLGPSRKPIAEINVQDEIVTIDVPVGADGQCWSMAPHGHFAALVFERAELPGLLAQRDLVAARRGRTRGPRRLGSMSGDGLCARARLRLALLVESHMKFAIVYKIVHPHAVAVLFIAASCSLGGRMQAKSQVRRGRIREASNPPETQQ